MQSAGPRALAPRALLLVRRGQRNRLSEARLRLVGIPLLPLRPRCNRSIHHLIQASLSGRQDGGGRTLPQLI